MAEGNGETDRVAVKTYVPRYQKEEWQSRAADLDMSQSEFVRVMVQAGKRDFDLDTAETPSGDVTPGGEGLERQILTVLQSDGPLAWDELVAALTGEFEAQLEETLVELQSANRIQYSGRRGYTLNDE